MSSDIWQSDLIIYFVLVYACLYHAYILLSKQSPPKEFKILPLKIPFSSTFSRFTNTMPSTVMVNEINCLQITLLLITLCYHQLLYFLSPPLISKISAPFFCKPFPKLIHKNATFLLSLVKTFEKSNTTGLKIMDVGGSGIFVICKYYDMDENQSSYFLTEI